MRRWPTTSRLADQGGSRSRPRLRRPPPAIPSPQPGWRAETVTYVPPAAPPAAPARPQAPPARVAHVVPAQVEAPLAPAPVASPNPAYRPADLPSTPLLLMPLVGLNRVFD